MNKIFKVVWSKVKHCYVVVSEIAKNTTSGGARCCRMGKVSLAAAMAAAVLTGSFAMPNSAWAETGEAPADSYVAIHEDGYNYISTAEKINYERVNVGGTYFYVRKGFHVTGFETKNNQVIITEVSADPSALNTDALQSTKTSVDNIFISDKVVATTRRGYYLKTTDTQTYAAVTNGGGTTALVQKQESGNVDSASNLYGYNIVVNNTKITDNFDAWNNTNGKVEKAEYRDGRYYHNGKEVNVKSVYYLTSTHFTTETNHTWSGSTDPYVFLYNSGTTNAPVWEVYDGVVYGNHGEVLSTGVDGEGNIYTFWASESNDLYTPVTKMTVSELNTRIEEHAKNMAELAKADFNSISLTPASDESPKNVIDFKDFAGDTIDSINVSVTGGTVDSSGNSTGNRKVLFSNEKGRFELETGSIVSANDGEDWEGETSLKDITINGQKYTIQDTDTKYEVTSAAGTGNVKTTYTLSEVGGSEVGVIEDTDTKILSGEVVDSDPYDGSYDIKLQTNEPNGNGGSGNKTIDIVNLHDYYTTGVSVNGSSNNANVQFNRNDGNSYNVNFTAGGGTLNDPGDTYIKIGGTDGIKLSTGSKVEGFGVVTPDGEATALSEISINGEQFLVPTINANTGSSTEAPYLTSIELNGKTYNIVSQGSSTDYSIVGEKNNTTGEYNNAYIVEDDAIKLNRIDNLTQQVEEDAIVINDVASAEELDDVRVIAKQGWQLKVNNNNPVDIGKNEEEGFGQLELTDGKNIAITQENNVVTISTNPDVEFDSVIVGGRVSVSTSGINMSGQKITGLADGKDDSDAVNVSQLEEAVSNLTTNINSSKTVVVEGNNVEVNSATDEKTGQVTYTVNAKKTTVSTDDANLDVTPGTEDANGVTDYKVTLKESITLGSANSTNVNINGDAGTITATTKDGNNNTTGQVTIDSANNKITVGVGGANNNQVVIDGGTGTITGLSNTTWDGTNVVADRAATEGQLQAAISNIQTTVNNSNITGGAINNDGTITLTKGNGSVTLTGKLSDNSLVAGTYDINSDNNVVLNIRDKYDTTAGTTATIQDVAKASNLGDVSQLNADLKQTNNSGAAIHTDVVQAVNKLDDKVNQGWTTTINGSTTVKNVKMGDTQDFKEGSNIKLSADSGSIVVSTAEQVSFTKVTVGGVVVDSAGINAGDKKITNVDNGDVSATSKDAVNGSQLYATNQAVINNYANIQQLQGNDQYLDSRINQLGSKVNKVGAGAAALAALHPMDFDPDDKLSFAVGAGNYAGETATALGAFYRPNEKVMMNVAGTYGNGENMVNMGVSFALDRTNHVSNSRTAMAKEIVDLREQVATQGQQIAQLVALVNQLAGVKEPVAPTVQPFPDVPANHWAYEYLNNLVAMGVIEGYPDGTFGGDRTMTRYEFATMLFKAMQNGAVLSEQIRQEFNAELGRIRVDRIKGADDDANKIERVRVNNYEDRDDYGSKIVMVSAGK